MSAVQHHRLSALLLLLPLFSGAEPLPVPDLDAPVLRQAPLPDGRQLMEEVRQQLPSQALDLLGFVQTRDKEKGTRLTRQLETELRFGDSPPHAVYRLSDGDSPTESLRIDWTAAGPVFQTQAGTSPETIGSKSAGGTGITWSDLSLDFLWWPSAKTLGRERIKTRPCFIVELLSPDGREAQRLHAWIDAKARFVVKAEIRDAEGSLTKKIEVDSIKEIEKDRWMVKDLEVRDYLNNRKTLIRIEEVRDLARSTVLPVD